MHRPARFDGTDYAATRAFLMELNIFLRGRKDMTSARMIDLGIDPLGGDIDKQVRAFDSWDQEHSSPDSYSKRTLQDWGTLSKKKNILTSTYM